MSHVHKNKYINGENDIKSYYKYLVSPMGVNIISFHLQNDKGKQEGQVDVNLNNGTVKITDSTPTSNTYNFDLQHNNIVDVFALTEDNHRSVWYKFYFVKSGSDAMEFKISNDKDEVIFGHLEAHKHKINQSDQLQIDPSKMKNFHTTIDNRMDPEDPVFNGYVKENKDSDNNVCPRNLYPYFIQWLIVLVLIFWLVILLAKWVAN